MLFPWIGVFEQINLCDYYVHLDDVQIPQGRSFINRVQIKTNNGTIWLTIPLARSKSYSKIIKDIKISYEERWIDKHIKLLAQTYTRHPYKNDVLELVLNVYSKYFEKISEMNIYAIELIAKYFQFNKTFLISSELNTSGQSSKKLLNIVTQLNGNTYITGHGALDYLDYDLFEKKSIRVEYINYQKSVYSQAFGTFTPYVSILDMIASEGVEGKRFINSQSIYWKDFQKSN